MSEKNLPPTHSRLRQARLEGQVGVSQDLIKIIRLLAIGELAFLTEAQWRRLLADLFDAALRQAARPLVIDLGALAGALLPLILLLLAMAWLPALIAMITTLAQTRFNIASEAFSKGFDKLNPATNLTQLVSAQKLVPAVLGPIKAAALLAVVTLKILDHLPDLMLLFRISLAQGWSASMLLLQSVLHSCVALLIVIGITDVLLQRYLVYRQLRMDISEVKRDYKQNEGDPQLKQGRKRFAKETLMSEGAAPPPASKPSAVVVNPQHLAVSLLFEPGVTGVPVVLEKASDRDARALRHRARQDGIPVIRYVSLARHLYAGAPVGEAVPAYTFKAVALLFHVAEQLKAQEDGEDAKSTAPAPTAAAAYDPDSDDDIHDLPEVMPHLGDSMLAGY